jgi:hypothetical protein
MSKCIGSRDLVLLFDYSAFPADQPDYGSIVFDAVFSGVELKENSRKIVISIGDMLPFDTSSDIHQYVINDEICTVDFVRTQNVGPYSMMLEDIDAAQARQLDCRLKSEMKQYLGMAAIDLNSNDARKQFWKRLLRTFSVEGTTLTVFANEEEFDNFRYTNNAKDCGYAVVSDGFSSWETGPQGELIVTRQSSRIHNEEQLNKKEADERNSRQQDVSRGLLEMNFALVQEVGIAGAQIWKAVEDIDTLRFPDTNDFFPQPSVNSAFTSLYMASQGVERLMKVCVELIEYTDKDKKQSEKAYELLYSHNHSSLLDFICGCTSTSVNRNLKHIATVLYRFYNRYRYRRYQFDETHRSEFDLLSEFIDTREDPDFIEKSKHKYCKELGLLSHFLYETVRQLSSALNIFVYELEADSVAYYSLSGDGDLWNTLQQLKTAKRELLWYLINKGGDLPFAQYMKEFSPLDLDSADINEMTEDLISTGRSSMLLSDAVDSEYDELCASDKLRWRERVNTINCLIANTSTILYDEEGQEAIDND